MYTHVSNTSGSSHFCLLFSKVMVIQGDVSDDRLLIWSGNIDVFSIKKTSDLQLLLGDIESVIEVINVLIWIKTIKIDQIRTM